MSSPNKSASQTSVSLRVQSLLCKLQTHSTSLLTTLKSYPVFHSRSRVILWGVTGVALCLGGHLIFRFVDRNLVHMGPALVLAAGNETGESYRLSLALKEVVENNSTIRIHVCATDGTGDNIRALELTPLQNKAVCIKDRRPNKESISYEVAAGEKLKAHLITAQNDSLYQKLIAQEADSSESRPELAAQVLARLYPDHFQLLVSPYVDISGENNDSLDSSGQVIIVDPEKRDFSLVENPNYNFSELNSTIRSLKIDTPEGGGQRESLKELLNYFDIDFPEKNHVDLGLSDADTFEAIQDKLQNKNVNAIFRVRRLGNPNIQKLIEDGWRLVAIPQAEALENTRYPAYNPSKIPGGTYQGRPAVPEIDLNTIAVDRLLVAHQKDVPNWMAKIITRILFENQQELREELVKLAEEKGFDPDTITPLTDQIREPESNSIVPIHRGAQAFYKPLFGLFLLVENADFIALLASGIPLGYWGWIQIKNIRTNSQIKQLVEHMKQINTDQGTVNHVEQKLLSEYSKSSTLNIKRPLKKWWGIVRNWYGLNKPSNQTNDAADKVNGEQEDEQSKIISEEELKIWLKNLVSQHDNLDESFQSASEILDHEGFRAYSEAYKSAREMLEREIEERQRKFSSIYVDQVVDLLVQLTQHQDNVDLTKLSDKLDVIFVNAAQTLTKDDIFSRESFRTFSEAYDIAREMIERKKREQALAQENIDQPLEAKTSHSLQMRSVDSLADGVHEVNGAVPQSPEPTAQES